MDAFSHIKQMMLLVESIESDIIQEAKHDDEFKASVDSVKRIIKDSEVDYTNTINQAVSTYKSVKGESAFVNFPPTWKMFVIDYIIVIMLNRIIELYKEQNDTVDIRKIQQKLQKMVRRNATFSSATTWKSFDSFMDKMKHYAVSSFPEIINYDPQVSDRDIFLVLNQIEKEELSKLEDDKQLIPTESYEEEDISLFLDTGDMKWYQLNMEYCELEGGAMGHCGNSADNTDGDTILSLRREVNKDGRNFHRPSLTFILHDSGLLGEMKGRANNKPAERYHKYIVPLLLDKRIEGIQGGGYEEYNNFQIDDLSKEDYETVRKARGDDFMAQKDGLEMLLELAEEIEGEGWSRDYEENFVKLLKQSAIGGKYIDSFELSGRGLVFVFPFLEDENSILAVNNYDYEISNMFDTYEEDIIERIMDYIDGNYQKAAFRYMLVERLLEVDGDEIRREYVEQNGDDYTDEDLASFIWDNITTYLNNDRNSNELEALAEAANEAYTKGSKNAYIDVLAKYIENSGGEIVEVLGIADSRESIEEFAEYRGMWKVPHNIVVDLVEAIREDSRPEESTYDGGISIPNRNMILEEVDEEISVDPQDIIDNF